MKIYDFTSEHIEEAAHIAKANYEEERSFVPILPQLEVLPGLSEFAENGLGVTAFDDGKMLGFLCCYKPWDNAFTTTNAKGTFSPIHAHGSVFENRETIYSRLYQGAARKWVSKGIGSHAIGLYAHDKQALNSFFVNGFGLRCVDAIRPMEKIVIEPCVDFIFSELEKEKVNDIIELRRMLSLHLGESPCFMKSTPQDAEAWITRASLRDSRVFTARKDQTVIAFVEVRDEGENFAADVNGMKNICGAFCMLEHRGKGVFQNLINYMITILKSEGYNRLGVDFESFNPTGNGFWLKYFSAYTSSVVRRIDENALKVLL